MNALQRFTLTGSLVFGFLMGVPGAAFARGSIPVVDLSSVTISLSGDGSGWTISFIAPPGAPSDASYLVATKEDSYCNAVGTDAVDAAISCDLPLLDDPSTEPTVSRIDFVPPEYNPVTNGLPLDISSATVAINSDGSGWTIAWKTLSGAVEGGSYVVNTTDGSTCTADGVDAVEGVASCDVGLLDDPSIAPEIANIRFFPVIVEYTGGPAPSVDMTTATMVLNADGTGWTVTWSELASDGGQLSYVVTTASGESCYADGTGVEGTRLSCDLPLLADPSESPTLDSIRIISMMYDARGALNDGATKYVTTTIPPVSTVQHAAPVGLSDDVILHDGGRSSTWVWISGLVGFLVSSGVLLRRKIMSRGSSGD
ncbi:MAG: hypothetical protein WCG62_01670 [Actinomycetes bacterium]